MTTTRRRINLPAEQRPAAQRLSALLDQVFGYWIAAGEETDQTCAEYRERIAAAIERNPALAIEAWTTTFARLAATEPERLGLIEPDTREWGSLAELAADEPPTWTARSRAA